MVVGLACGSLSSRFSGFNNSVPPAVKISFPDFTSKPLITIEDLSGACSTERWKSTTYSTPAALAASTAAVVSHCSGHGTPPSAVVWDCTEPSAMTYRFRSRSQLSAEDSRDISFPNTDTRAPGEGRVWYEEEI